MDLQDFVKNATRTESIKTEVLTNKEMFLNVAKIFLLSGQMLDQYKKNVFYDREIKQDVLVDNFRAIAESMTSLSQQLKSNSQAEKTDVLQVNPRIFHGIVGVATEATELMEQLVRAVDQQLLIDPVDVLEEMFDVSWYSAIVHDALNTDMEHTFNCGIDKLRIRFPDKFNNDAANNRNIEAERQILNKMVE